MIHIVTGDGPRCGSTMMMQALQKGGIPPKWSLGDEHMEINASAQGLPNFPDPKEFDGCCIKLFAGHWGRLSEIVPGDYRMIWLHRPSGERWESFHKQQDDESYERWADGSESRAEKARFIRDGKSADVLEIMKLRPDVQVTEMDYHEICENPLSSFLWLRNIGWPINPELAAEIPTSRSQKNEPI